MPPIRAKGDGKARMNIRLLVGFALGVCLQLPAAEKFTNIDCLDCHLDPSTTRTVGTNVIPLLFPTNAFHQSVHAKLDCIDCHEGIKDLVHESKLPPPNCAQLSRAGSQGVRHEHPRREPQLGAPARPLAGIATARTTSCRSSTPTSPVFKLNLPQTCAKCHSNPGLTKEYQMKYPEAAAQYMDSIHGRALLKMGLIVAPPATTATASTTSNAAWTATRPINHANIAKTCGKCHVGIEEIYNKSVHGQLLAKGDKRGPVCTDCHTAHEIETPQNGHFKMASDAALRQMPRGPPGALPRHLSRQGDGAGQTERRLRRRRLLRLPRPPRRVAAVRIPPRTCRQANILATCQQCHPRATAGFHRIQAARQPAGRQELSRCCTSCSWA